MIVKPEKRRHTADEVLKFGYVGGHYVSRCGNIIAVSPKVAFSPQEWTTGICLLPEGYYDIADIDMRLVPDCLKTDEEYGQ